MRVLRWLDRHFEETIMVVLLMFMVLIMGVQVFARYVLNASLAWSEEIIRYLFIWCGFFSIALCTRFGIALSVDQLIHVMPPKAARIIGVFEVIVCFAFFLYLIPAAFNFVKIAFNSGRLSPAARIPIWIIQAAPLCGFAAGSIRCFQRIVFIVTGKTKKEK